MEVEEEERGAPKMEYCRQMKARRAPPEGGMRFAAAPEVVAGTAMADLTQTLRENQHQRMKR